MDLRLFHPTDGKTSNYKRLDHQNNRTGYFACHFLEWIGWYNFNIAQRLLGHYRLFQLFKLKYLKDRTELPPVDSYILQYRETRYIKLYFSRIVAFLQPIVEFGMTSRQIEIHSINRMLLHERSDILKTFLADAEEDFDQAFLAAKDAILDNRFLYAPPADQVSKQLFVQIKEEHQHNSHFSNHELHFHSHQQIAPPQTVPDPPVDKKPIGKQAGVFSKKQILILFDLLARDGKWEAIDFGKRGKYKAIAHLLRAITGRVEETWIDELNDYQKDSLYTHHNPGQLQELIRTLENIAGKFNDAGFKSIVKLVNRKLSELDRERHRY